MQALALRRFRLNIYAQATMCELERYSTLKSGYDAATTHFLLNGARTDYIAMLHEHN